MWDQAARVDSLAVPALELEPRSVRATAARVSMLTRVVWAAMPVVLPWLLVQLLPVPSESA